MIYQIRHRITYRYDQPVLLEPMTIRLRPRSDGMQTLHDWHCLIEPVPIAHRRFWMCSAMRRCKYLLPVCTRC